MIRFLKDIHDPHYVENLYNINRPKGSPPVQLAQSDKLHFGAPTCKQVTYKCRVQNQYTQLRKEAFKLHSMYMSCNNQMASLSRELHELVSLQTSRESSAINRDTILESIIRAK